MKKAVLRKKRRKEEKALRKAEIKKDENIVQEEITSNKEVEAEKQTSEKENVEKSKNIFNSFFDFKDNKKKSSDE